MISSFMDDILIVMETFEKLLSSLSKLLNWLAEVGLTAHPTKCQLAFDSLDFLHHMVAQGYMYPEEKNVDKFRSAPRP